MTVTFQTASRLWFGTETVNEVAERFVAVIVMVLLPALVRFTTGAADVLNQLPVIVTKVAVAFAPHVGLIAITRGGARTEKEMDALVPSSPSGLTTVTFHVPASRSSGTVTVNEVAERFVAARVRLEEPLLVRFTTGAVVLLNWDPLTVTSVVPVFMPEAGTIPARIGGAVMVNVTEALVPSSPFGLTTVTFQTPASFPEGMYARNADVVIRDAEAVTEILVKPARESIRTGADVALNPLPDTITDAVDVFRPDVGLIPYTCGAEELIVKAYAWPAKLNVFVAL